MMLRPKSCPFLLLSKPRRAHYATHATHKSPPLVHIPKSKIYRFGDPNSARPIFHDLDWTVREGESWAVVGSGSGEKTALLETLIGHYRVAPSPSGGPFPLFTSQNLESIRPLHELVMLVSFAHRPRASGGAFYDYTARYGAVREEDRVTLRQSMFPEHSTSDLDHPPLYSIEEPSKSSKDGMAEKKKQVERQRKFEEWVSKLGLEQFLDLPFIALSNGQTRRARIVKALLDSPELLLLDEPLTGLDIDTRPMLLEMLHALHESRNPRVIMGLRLQDPIPEWVSHLALVRSGKVTAGPKADILAETEEARHQEKEKNYAVGMSGTTKGEGRALIEMKDVNVKYHERHVLKNINWTIRTGDRWHLQGANGSGKTTLCSLLTGDHPQSYTQRSPSIFSLFGSPRRSHALTTLRTRIGVVSPELYNAWPRARPMTVWEAVGTGFDGGFVPLGEMGLGVGLSGGLNTEERAWRERRVKEVLEGLGPHTWGSIPEASHAPHAKGSETKFEDKLFSSLSAGEQSVVLLMRALVGRPELVLLDEVWAGMDEGMIGAARRYLREGGVSAEQGVVVISHWEDEVPWGVEDGVRRFRLEDGVGREA